MPSPEGSRGIDPCGTGGGGLVGQRDGPVLRGDGQCASGAGATSGGRRRQGEQEGEPRLAAAGLGNLGIAYGNWATHGGPPTTSSRHLAIFREIGDRRGEGEALGNVGTAYRQLGDARRAVGYFEQAQAISRELGDRRGEGNALGNLGERLPATGRTPGGQPATSSRPWRFAARSATGRVRAPP